MLRRDKATNSRGDSGHCVGVNGGHRPRPSPPVSPEPAQQSAGQPTRGPQATQGEREGGWRTGQEDSGTVLKETGPAREVLCKAWLRKAGNHMVLMGGGAGWLIILSLYTHRHSHSNTHTHTRLSEAGWPHAGLLMEHLTLSRSITGCDIRGASRQSQSQSTLR